MLRTLPLPTTRGQLAALHVVGDGETDHGLAEVRRHLGEFCGVVVVRDRLYNGLGALRLVVTLAVVLAVDSRCTYKIPDPTNTPSLPSCIMSAASAGVATPPAAKLTTGRRFRRAVSLSRWNGAWC